MNNPILSVDVDWVTNYNQFITLISFLTKKFNVCNKIIFIDSHHNIIKYLNPQDKFIVNIDEHHDIIQLNNNKDWHMGNWVDYLINKSQLDHYIWVCNTNSSLIPEEIDPVRNLKTFKINHDLNEINSMDFNKIIICKSFDFISLSQKNMGLGLIFEVLKEISLNLFKEKTIIDTDPNPYTIYKK
jgi:hypothetical protein